MNNTPFTIAQMRPIRDGMTVSRPAHLGAVPVTWFSLGARKLRLHHALYRGRGRRLLCAGRRCTPHADMPR